MGCLCEKQQYQPLHYIERISRLKQQYQPLHYIERISRLKQQYQPLHYIERISRLFAHLRGNARVFTYQMWTNGQRTKTNPKTSPEQSAIFHIFHYNKAKNVTSIVFDHKVSLEPHKENCPSHPGGHFHDDWANNVTSRVHVIQLTRTIFKLNSCIKETNVQTKFNENWAKNEYINKTNVWTNFHDDWAKIVTSKVFTRKTDPPTGGHVFQRTGTFFELNQHIIKANILTNFELGRDIIGTILLTKFHEDRK
ncbi:hypothetical protein DPMN_179759 [Dreissena polymorpha]|uniref:Uncharacterized protein n=1 Tax=Dreissena polymorpha TaxID=45954 RepID=A0A9D4EFN9_DREPO|nr:hypothetical protein DPMN_179759 [Dreissena polymorpha]